MRSRMAISSTYASMSENRPGQPGLPAILGLLLVWLMVGLAPAETQAAEKVLGTYETRLGPGPGRNRRPPASSDGF